MGEHRAANAMYAAVGLAADEVNLLNREEKVDFSGSYLVEEEGYKVTIIVEPIGAADRVDMERQTKRISQADIISCINYWRKKLFEELNVPYGNKVPPKDRQCVKSLLEAYRDVAYVKRMMDFTLMHPEELKKIGVRGCPSLGVVWGFRQSIIHAMNSKSKDGAKKKKSGMVEL